MKLTQVLCRQNLGRMIKFNWFAATKQTPAETHAEYYLNKHGKPVMNAAVFLAPERDVVDIHSFNEHSLQPPTLAKDENHPDYKERPCLKVLDNELLVEAVVQAQNLTKTLVINNSLPEKIESLIENHGEGIDETIRRIIQTSNIFDAQQVKLPKRKDPERPAWNFPRDYGINGVRKSRNLAVKFMQLCETLCGPQIAQQRQIIHDGVVKVSLFKDGDLLDSEIKVDLLMTSSKPLRPMGSPEDAASKSFPELYPLLPTVGFRQHHFYDLGTLYPVSEESAWSTPHTLFIYHDVENVKNLTELPVREEQREARSLIKSFVTAASFAKKMYGDTVDDLPEPVTLQCIQSDSKNFHFSVFQLNTLNLDNNADKCNYWWTMPQIDLFKKANYENGRPVLEGYNPEVFKRIMAFYKNV